MHCLLKAGKQIQDNIDTNIHVLLLRTLHTVDYSTYQSVLIIAAIASKIKAYIKKKVQLSNKKKLEKPRKTKIYLKTEEEKN